MMKRLLLVDLSAVFARAWHAGADQDLGFAFEATVKKIRWLATSEAYDGVAVCCDAPPYLRKQIDPAYKANREKSDPSMVDQLRRVKERLTADGFALWASQGYEADDVIASASVWAAANGHAVHIATADKDLCALVSEHTQIRNTSTDELFDIAKVREKFGVPPHKMPDWLALIGDKSDNVQGVAGIGPVKAAKLIADYDSVPQLLAVLRSGSTVGKPAEHAALKAAQESGQLAKSLELVSLRFDVPGIEWAQILEPRVEKTLAKNDDATDAIFTAHEREMSEAPSDDKSEPLPPLTAPTTDAKPQVPVVTATASLAVRPFEHELEPNSLQQAMKLAVSANDSRAFGIANAETALAMIIRGRSLGIDAITSLSSFHIIKNRMTLTANMIEGMVMRSEHCEYFMCSESTSERCTWVTKRRSNPKEQSHTWTIEDAKRMGLSAEQWQKQPRTMLRHRCATDFARLVYPDVVAGLYSVDEVSDDV